MKKFKKLAGIFLTLVLMLQCTTGLVIKPKAADAVTVTVNGAVTKDGNDVKIPIEINNSGAAVIGVNVELTTTWSGGSRKITKSYYGGVPTGKSNVTLVSSMYELTNDNSMWDVTKLNVSAKLSGIVTGSAPAGYSIVTFAYNYNQYYEPGSSIAFSIKGAAAQFTYQVEIVLENGRKITTPVLDKLEYSQTVGKLESGIASVSITNVKPVYEAEVIEVDPDFAFVTPTKATMTISGEYYAFSLTVSNTSEVEDVKDFKILLTFLDGTNERTYVQTAGALAAGASKDFNFNIGANNSDKGFGFPKFKIQEVKSAAYGDAFGGGFAGPQISGNEVTWNVLPLGEYNGNTISWRVVKNDATGVTLMANSAIDVVPFSSKMMDACTWDSELCALREYLNNDFLTEFSETVPADKLIANADAADAKVWVPSIAELVTYGMSDNSTQTVFNNQMKPNAVALKNISATGVKGGYCNWYLRDPGAKPYDVAYVNTNGNIDKNGCRVYSKATAMVPVIKIAQADLASYVSSSDITSYKSKYVNSAVTAASTNTQVSEDIVAKPEVNLAKVGSTKTINKVTYKVTAASEDTMTVAVVGVKKSLKSVTIPSTVKIDGVAYKVTSIKADAFKNAKKTLKTVVISSKNIASMSKSAFKSLKAKTKIKVPSSLYKKYKSWIVKSNKKVSVKKSK